MAVVSVDDSSYRRTHGTSWLGWFWASAIQSSITFINRLNSRH